MVLTNSASRSRNHNRSIASTNLGGGPIKQGLPYQVGRESWTSIFFRLRTYPPVVEKTENSLRNEWVLDNNRNYDGKYSNDYNSYSSNNTTHLEFSNYDTENAITNFVNDNDNTLFANDFDFLSFDIDENNILTFSGIRPGYSVTNEFNNLALPLDLEEIEFNSVYLHYFKMVKSANKYFAFVGLVSKPNVLYDPCVQSSTENIVFQIYQKNNTNVENNDWIKIGNNILYSLGEEDLNGYPLIEATQYPVSSSNEPFTNRYFQYGIWYIYYFIMKIPEPNSNEKLTFKLYKELINGGTLANSTVEEPTNNLSSVDNYFLE